MKLGGFFIVLAFVLAACSSDPKPREPEPTSTSAPTSTATPPPMPAQASKDSPEGAAAFVTYWVEVLNYTARTGDILKLTDLSSAECSGCASYTQALASVPGGTRRPTGDYWRLRRVDAGSSREPVTVVVEAAVREGSTSVNYQFAFELNSAAPFRVTDLSIVEPK